MKAWPEGPGPLLAGCPEGPRPSSNTFQKVGHRLMFSFVFEYVCTENTDEQLQIKTAEASLSSHVKEESWHQPINEFSHAHISHQTLILKRHCELSLLFPFPGWAEASQNNKYWFCVKARWRPSPTWRPVWPGTWTVCLWTKSTTPGRRSGGGSCPRASGTGCGRGCRGSASAC